MVQAFRWSLRGQVSAAALTATLAFAASGISAPASAQEEVAAADDFGETIIVVARRTEEDIQDVPIAITAIGGETLRELSVTDPVTLMKNVPGVNLCCNSFNNVNLTFVRGLATGAPTYFGEIPVDPTGYGNFFDISSVEVLKGPQGTLFGQASSAGAFVYRPNRPEEETGGYLSVMLGGLGRRNVEGAVNLALADGNVLFRVSGISGHRDGYVRDLANNIDYGNEDYWIVRPQLTVRIGENFENNLLYQHSYAETDGFSSGLWVLQDINFNPGQVPQNALLLGLNGDGTQAAFDALRTQILLERQALGPYRINGLSAPCAPGQINFGSAPVTSLATRPASCPLDRFVDDRVINISTLNIGDDWTVKNIFGFFQNRVQQGIGDLDTSPLHLLSIRSQAQTEYVPGPEQFSNEFQVQGTLGIFDLTAGVFFLNSDQDTGIVQNGFLTFPSARRTEVSRRSRAIYGQTNIRITDELSATVGARYTWDKASQSYFNFNAVTLAPTTTVNFPELDFKNLSYTAGLQYFVSPEVMLFVTNARGYNSGGFNDATAFPTFSPAVLNNVEGGIKSTFDLGDVRARFNATAYHGWYDNAQVFVFLLVNQPGGGQTTVGTTQNAAKAKIKGFEIEASVIPIEGLELSGWVAHQDNVYTEWNSVDPVTLAPLDLSNTEFLFSPKWKWGGHAEYRLPLDESFGDISVTADWTRRSNMTNTSIQRQLLNPANPMSGLQCSRDRTIANGYPAAVADGKRIYVDCNPGYDNLDIGLHWNAALGHEGLSLDLQVTNVTKNILTDSKANVRDFGFVSPMPAVPRTWTLRVSYDF